MTTKSLAQKLQAYKNDHLYRQRYAIEKNQGVVITIENRDYITFCHNDYLGLSTHPEVIRAMQQAAQEYGVGSGASQLVTGHKKIHSVLEEQFAKFLGQERALIFPTGYMANLGVFSAILNRNDRIFQDKQNHASLIDAAILSRAKLHRFKHGNIQDLEKQLCYNNHSQSLIATDGVFSMTGDIAPLPEMANLAEQYKAWLMIDDAHSIGFMGKNGRGTLEHYNLSTKQAPIIVCPLGKAFGCFGGVVASCNEVIESCIQFSRSYIYTTGIPPAIACAALKSLELIQQESWRREKLHEIIKYFIQQAASLNLPLHPSTTPIQSIILGDPLQTVLLSQKLLEHGLWVSAIRPPTVPQNSSRLRISLSALHTKKMIDKLLTTLSSAYIPIAEP